MRRSLRSTLAFVLGALLGAGPLWADLQRFGGGSGGPVSTTTGTFSTSVTVGTTTTAGTATCVIDSAMGGASATDNFLNCTGTFPATLSAAARAVLIAPTFTTQNQIQAGLWAEATNSGSNVTSQSFGGAFVNHQQGSGSIFVGGAATTLNAVTVQIGLAGAVDANSNTVAVYGDNASNVGGITSVGVIGATHNANSATIGVWGNAPDSTGGNAGGYFTVGHGTGAPTVADAALLADNTTTTSAIFVARDNGTAVFTIADGGSVTARSIAPESQASYDFGTSNALDWRRMYLRNGINDDDANRKGSGNMIIQGYNATTGTDQVGATLILGDGKGTGAAIPGNVTVRVTTPLATGTTLQSHQDRGIYVGKRLTLADNSVTTFLTVAMGNDTHCGGSIDFAVWADDNTNDGRQLTAGEITYTGVDKTAGAGGEDCDAALKGTNVTSLSPTNGGTVLTVTTTATTGTDLCNVRITADSDLAVVSLITLTYNVRPFGSGACTVTPQ